MSARTKSPPLLDIERKKLLWRRFKIVSWITSVIAIVGFTVYAVFFSSLSKVKSIDVNGNESLSGDEVTSALEEIIRGNGNFRDFFGSDSLFFWGNVEIQDLGASYPKIYRIAVNRDWLKRRISISVEEREKFAIWCENGCYWLDDHGVVFSEAPIVDGSLLKVVNVNSDRFLNLGTRPLGGKETENLYKIFAFLKDYGFVATRIEIENLEFKEIVAKVQSGQKIYFS
ncbi:MAG: hypothetical protein HYR95_00555, partial [Candidatus Colwellbacteria bacterium]|nr:hypothetical protein [Candidatus Colwellbacteria bacterium]